MAVAPALIAILPVVATVAGTALSVIGAISTANANQQAYNYQAMVADRNKQVALQNSERATQNAQIAAQQQDQTTRALLGEQIATQSASGLRIGGRSQMLTRKSARELGRLDALNIRQAGDIESYNFKVQADDSASEATFNRSAGNNAMLSGWLDAGSALIGGVSSIKLPGGRSPISSGTSLLGKMKVPSKRLLSGA